VEGCALQGRPIEPRRQRQSLTVRRRKKTQPKAKRISFKPGKSKAKKRRKKTGTTGLKAVLKVFGAVIFVGALAAGIAIGFVSLDRYVHRTVHLSESTGTLELVDVPVWVNDRLENKVYAAAQANGEDLRLDENAAASVQKNLQSRIAWLDDVTVQTTGAAIRIRARWRKPVALVEAGRRKCYVDEQLVVLDYLPLPTLPIVAVKGLASTADMPPAGGVWDRPDLAAGVAILTRLDRMDRLVASDKPLLYEIERVDVSNFNGRKDPRASHIALYATDNTKIIWGAEIGAWQRHMEASDEEKLAKLYAYYQEYGSLLDGAKYVNLRNPQGAVSEPIDNY